MTTGRDYTRFTFDDILDALQQSLREDLPEFTETDDHEPLIQFARFVSYIGHRDAAMIDLVASELSWPTLQRRRSAVALATLVGQSLLPASPASTTVLLDLIGDPGPADIVLADQALFRTGGDADNPSVVFESQEGSVAVGNLTFTLVAEEAGVFGTPATTTLATPWATPNIGDAIYYGHPVLTWDAMQLTGTGSPTGYSTTLDYYDGHHRTSRPDDGSISVGASGITMGVDDLIGSPTAPVYNGSGLTIRVTHNDTGESQDVVAQYPQAPGTYIVTNGFLGQSTPSTNEGDYTLSAAWLPLVEDADGGAILENTIAGAYDRTNAWAHPSDIRPNGLAAARKWQKTTVAGTEAYWIRERIWVVTTPTGPTGVTAAVADEQTWTLQAEALQGQTVEDVLGTSTAAAFEEFDLNESPYVGGSFSELDIGGDTEWTQVTELLSYASEDKVFQLLERPDGTRYISFGDNTNGRIPPAGQAITATYRVDADGNGNVGVGTVVNAETGANYLSNSRNPQGATGWKEAEGFTTTSLQRLRRIIPAGVRSTRNVAVTAEDVEYLATQVFTTSDGRSPFARVAVIEQGYGYKTLLAVCVGAGGTVPTDADVEELQTWFNGTTIGFQRLGGNALANQRVICQAYTPEDLTVSATLTVSKRYASTARAAAEAAIIAAASPLAVNGEGLYRHFPGGTVTDAFFISILGAADIDGLVNAVVTSSPALPVTLVKTGLPRSGAPDAPIIPQITVLEV